MKRRQDLVAELEQLPRALNQRSALTALRNLAHSSNLNDLLDDACERANLDPTLATLSQRHPLGFDKYTLLASKNFQLRLHVWWPDTGHRREDIHDHRFDAVSILLVGRLFVDNYLASADGELMAEFAEEHVTGEGTYSFNQRGATRVRNIGSLVLERDSAYSTPADVLHRVIAGDVLTATLFLKIPREGRSQTSIVVPSSGSHPKHTEGTPLNADQYIQQVSRFRDSLV